LFQFWDTVTWKAPQIAPPTTTPTTTTTTTDVVEGSGESTETIESEGSGEDTTEIPDITVEPEIDQEGSGMGSALAIRLKDIPFISDED
jgi:hypothetical protein